MSQICVPIPPLEETRSVDLDVTINEQKQHVQYRVEILEWPEAMTSRVEALQAFIQRHADEWLLVQIGTPTETFVPVLFRLRTRPEPPTQP